MKIEKSAVAEVATGKSGAVVASENGFTSSFSYSFPVNLKEAFRNGVSVIVSPHFFLNGLFWAIKLRIKEDPNIDIEVFLVSYIGRDPITLEEKTIEIAATFWLYVLGNVSDDNISHSFGPELRTLDSKSKHGDVMGVLLISKEKLLSHPYLYIPDNVLTIGCDLNWAHHYSMETLPSPKNPFPLKPNSFERFFNNPKFNDVKISTAGQIFHASKWVLCEASDVFEQLIFSESPDGTNTINIEDIDSDAFEGVLRYISCKVLPDLQLEEHAEDWFKITHKFKLHALQNVLQKGFLLQLKPSNAVMCLKTADKYSVADLRKKCIQYIQENWKEVAANHGLEKFTVSCTDAKELLKSRGLLGEVTESLPVTKKPRLN